MSCLILSLGHYRYSADLVALDQCHTVKPIRLPYGLDHIVTPLLWQSWQASLADHPDRASINWLIAGIRDGFRIGYDYTRGKPKSSQRNLISALERPQVIREYLAKERAEGRIMGPFATLELPQLHVSWFGVIALWIY